MVAGTSSYECLFQTPVSTTLADGLTVLPEAEPTPLLKADDPTAPSKWSLSVRVWCAIGRSARFDGPSSIFFPEVDQGKRREVPVYWDLDVRLLRDN